MIHEVPYERTPVIIFTMLLGEGCVLFDEFCRQISIPTKQIFMYLHHRYCILYIYLPWGLRVLNRFIFSRHTKCFQKN